MHFATQFKGYKLEKYSVGLDSQVVCNRWRGMCRECLKSERPERGEAIIEKGCWMFNFVCCAVCKHVSPMLAMASSSESEVKSVTTLRYNHVCIKFRIFMNSETSLLLFSFS